MNLLAYSLFLGFWIFGLILMIEGLHDATEAEEDADEFEHRQPLRESRERKRPFEIALNHRGS